MTASFIDVPLTYSEGGGDFTLPDPGMYIVEFLGVVATKDWPRTDKQGQPMYDDDGNKLMETSLTLQFVINDPEDEFNGVEFRDYFPARVTPGNKSGRLWAALLGTTPDKLPVPLPRVMEMAGRKANMNLSHRVAQNGNSYVKIDGVAPLKKRKPARQMIEDDEEPGF